MDNNNNPFLIDIKSVTYTKKWFDEFFKPDNGMRFKETMDSINSDWLNVLRYHIIRKPEAKNKVGNIQNWLRYRICYELGLGLDCDCNKNVFKMYNMILGTKNKQKNVNRERDFKVANYLLETDTMNSFATIFNQFMRDIIMNLKGIDWLKEYKQKYKLKKENALYRDCYFLEKIDDWYGCFSKKTDQTAEDIVKCFNQFNKFAKYTHCLANMILVPKGFNFSGRASATYDYWDLSLELLKSYQWYCNNLDKFLLEGCFNSNGSIAPLPAHPHYNKSFKSDKYLNCLTEINDRIEARAEALAKKLPEFTFDKTPVTLTKKKRASNHKKATAN